MTSVLAAATRQSSRGDFEGKTYTLRPSSQVSNEYYDTLRHLVDVLLQSTPDANILLQEIRALSRRKRTLARLLDKDEDTAHTRLAGLLHETLHPFTPRVQAHLYSLGTLDRWNRTLSMSEGQYHLAMVEIELVNRIYAGQFRSCGRKYAFLPHCLRDLTAECRSTQRDIDYVCKGCSDDCDVDRLSKLLRRHGVKPYIWMTADLGALFRRMKKEGETPGVLGIACVPELMRGMRMCLKYNVPVVGVPLDANRCARWWGEFHWNSVNISEVEQLLKD